MWSHIVLLLLSASLVACAHVTTWGGDFEPIPEEDHQYSLKLFPNAFATSEDVEEKAKEFITEFMERNSYEDYEILSIGRGEWIESYEYTLKFYENTQERKLSKIKTKQQQAPRGPVDFMDDNPDFAERIRSTKSVLLLVDITVTHFDASARSGRDAIIDLTESREAAHTLADELSTRLNAAGYEVKETIHSSGWSLNQYSYRIRHNPKDRSLSPKELPLESPPFYVEERYIEESAFLEDIYNELEPSEDLVFSRVVSLAKRYDTDSIFVVFGIAQIPTEGRAIMGILDTLSTSSTHNARVWLASSAIMVAAQIIDAKTGKQIGIAFKGTQLDKQISTESLISVADQILEDYPKRLAEIEKERETALIGESETIMVTSVPTPNIDEEVKSPLIGKWKGDIRVSLSQGIGEVFMEVDEASDRTLTGTFSMSAGPSSCAKSDMELLLIQGTSYDLNVSGQCAGKGSVALVGNTLETKIHFRGWQYTRKVGLERYEN